MIKNKKARDSGCSCFHEQFFSLFICGFLPNGIVLYYCMVNIWANSSFSASQLGLLQQITVGWVVYTTNIYYFSQFWRLGSPRSKCQQIQCLMRVGSVSLVCRQPLSDCISIWHRVDRKSGQTLLPLLIRALIPFLRAPAS